MTSGLEMDQAIFLQPRSPHAACEFINKSLQCSHMKQLKVKANFNQPLQTWFFQYREVRRTECYDRSLCWPWCVALLWQYHVTVLLTKADKTHHYVNLHTFYMLSAYVNQVKL